MVVVVVAAERPAPAPVHVARLVDLLHGHPGAAAVAGGAAHVLRPRVLDAAAAEGEVDLPAEVLACHGSAFRLSICLDGFPSKSTWICPGDERVCERGERVVRSQELEDGWLALQSLKCWEGFTTTAVW